MDQWRVIDSGMLSPASAMAKDAALLADLDPEGPSCLHFYEWNGPCLTYGHFIKPELYLHVDALSSHGLQVAKRPTGGGVIFHLTDLSFSVLLPAAHPQLSINPLDNYAYINQKVAEAIKLFTLQSLQPQLLQKESACLSKACQAFCMAKPTQYDLMIDGKKVGGAAQRRTKLGLLHQTSLMLMMPSMDLFHGIFKNEGILTAMQQQSAALLPESASLRDLESARKQMKEILIKKFT